MRMLAQAWNRSVVSSEPSRELGDSYAHDGITEMLPDQDHRFIGAAWFRDKREPVA